MNISGSLCDVIANVLEVNKFESQSHDYVHFQTNTLGKGMNAFKPQILG